MNNLIKTKNDSAWEKLFKKYRIIENIKNNGQFTINSQEINEFREARLMTKFDHRNNLPILFQENDFSILPIARGSYSIAKFESYGNFEKQDNSPIEYCRFPENIQSIDYKNITSEATAINCAYVSGILKHFLEEDELMPTVSGRMSSGVFNFKINGYQNTDFINMNIANSQIEIDGGYEGHGSLSLIEAKNSLSLDFIIRQLYYPYRLWKDKISKQVKPIFMIYSNGLFYLYEYRFEDSENYNSLILVKQKRYTLEEKNISLEDIQNIMKKSKVIDEPKIPFPQADSFERVFNLCELLNEKVELTKDDITTTYDFNQRQTDYYINAARYLGFVENKNEEGHKFILTNKGLFMISSNYKERQLSLVRSILEHSVFLKAMELYIKKADIPSKMEIVSIMKKSNLYKITTDSTFNRRASTILGWINWILELQK